MSAQEHPTVTYRSGSQIWWVVAGLAVLVILGVALALRVAFSQFPPGTTLAGIDVRTPTNAAAVARDVSTALVDLPVELATAAGTTTVSAGRLGATLAADDLRTAADEATGFDAWSQRYTGGGPVELPIEVTVSGTDLDAVVESVSRDPVDGDLTITPTGVEVVQPVVGVDVTAEAIRQAVGPPLQALARTPLEEWPDPLAVTVEATETDPVVNQTAVDAALAEVERLTATPIDLTASVVPADSQTVDGQGPPLREQTSLALGTPDLRTMLTTQVDPAAIQRERLQIVPDASAPPPALLSFLEEAAVVPEMRVQVQNRSPTPPRDGPQGTGPGGPADQPRLADTSGITGDLVAEVVTPGLEPDVQKTVEAVVRAADRGEPTVAVAGTPVTAADPALLGIVEPVGTYTTYYTAGEGRVTNIHRIAEIVDGALIPPGANYDVNHAVGERTAEKGFVEGGAILDGEFVTDVGGGVSQFGTTFFNAMWFAGHDIITHTPHSFWFSRYPAGREATIDYPGVNLELNNNSPHWVLVDTAVTADSVTVTLWSTPFFTVEQSIGPREPIPGQDFRISINRLSTAPAIPELGAEAVNNADQFTHTYRAQ
ncbi:MAG TPA: VanW family protein [Euzebya sp.]|nr:VanW family protein [Euzebya sp.]